MEAERKPVKSEQEKQQEIKDYIDRKIEAEFSIIDRKLKNSFQVIKQDLYSLKYASGLGIGGRNREIQDVFDEKLTNLKRELEEKVEQLKKIEIQASQDAAENAKSKKKKSAKKIAKKSTKKTKEDSKIKSQKKQKKAVSSAKKKKIFGKSKPAKELSRVYELMQKQLESRIDDLKTKEAELSKQEKELDKFK